MQTPERGKWGLWEPSAAFPSLTHTLCLPAFHFAPGLVSRAPRTLEGIPSNILGEFHIRQASVCKSWRRSADGMEMPVANLGWSRCLWSLASSPQVPLLLRAPQSALDRGQGEGETGRQKALITTSITLSVVLESPPSRRTLLPCVLRHSPYNQRTRMLRAISGTTLSNPLTVQVLYNLFHFKSPVTLRCLPATP